MRVTKTYFMLMVQDMDRAVAFYRALGLQPRDINPYWTELGAGGVTVALHGGGDGRPTRTGLGFEVEDAHAAAATIRGAGGTILREPEAREGEPILLCEAQDPEGNGFSVAQVVG